MAVDSTRTTKIGTVDTIFEASSKSSGGKYV